MRKYSMVPPLFIHMGISKVPMQRAPGIKHRLVQ